MPEAPQVHKGSHAHVRTQHGPHPSHSLRGIIYFHARGPQYFSVHTVPQYHSGQDKRKKIEIFTLPFRNQKNFPRTSFTLPPVQKANFSLVVRISNGHRSGTSFTQAQKKTTRSPTGCTKGERLWTP